MTIPRTKTGLAEWLEEKASTHMAYSNALLTEAAQLERSYSTMSHAELWRAQEKVSELKGLAEQHFTFAVGFREEARAMGVQVSAGSPSADYERGYAAGRAEAAKAVKPAAPFAHQPVLDRIRAVTDALETEYSTAPDQRKDEINGSRLALWELAGWLQDQRDVDAERAYTLTPAGRRALELEAEVARLEDENDALREHIKILEYGIINTYDMIDRLQNRETTLEAEVEMLRVQDETSRAVAESFRVERDAARAEVNKLTASLTALSLAREQDMDTWTAYVKKHESQVSRLLSELNEARAEVRVLETEAAALRALAAEADAPRQADNDVTPARAPRKVTGMGLYSPWAKLRRNTALQVNFPSKYFYDQHGYPMFRNPNHSFKVTGLDIYILSAGRRAGLNVERATKDAPNNP